MNIFDSLKNVYCKHVNHLHLLNVSQLFTFIVSLVLCITSNYQTKSQGIAITLQKKRQITSIKY